MEKYVSDWEIGYLDADQPVFGASLGRHLYEVRELYEDGSISQIPVMLLDSQDEAEILADKLTVKKHGREFTVVTIPC